MDGRWCTEKTVHMCDHVNKSAFSERVVQCSSSGRRKVAPTPSAGLSDLLEVRQVAV